MHAASAFKRFNQPPIKGRVRVSYSSWLSCLVACSAGYAMTVAEPEVLQGRVNLLSVKPYC